MSTRKQINDVHFCEKVLGIKFEGNINSSFEVQGYLDDYLASAEEICNDAMAGYYSNMDY